MGDANGRIRPKAQARSPDGGDRLNDPTPRAATLCTQGATTQDQDVCVGHDRAMYYTCHHIALEMS